MGLNSLGGSGSKVGPHWVHLLHAPLGPLHANVN